MLYESWISEIIPIFSIKKHFYKHINLGDIYNAKTKHIYKHIKNNYYKCNYYVWFKWNN